MSKVKRFFTKTVQNLEPGNNNLKFGLSHFPAIQVEFNIAALNFFKRIQSKKIVIVIFNL